MYLIIRWFLNGLTLFAATYFIDGVHVRNMFSALVVALVLSFLNAVIRPILVFLTLPVTVLTFGLFVFVINALLIWFTSSIIKGFEVDNFATAFILGLFLWAGSMLTGWLLDRDAR